MDEWHKSNGQKLSTRVAFLAEKVMLTPQFKRYLLQKNVYCRQVIIQNIKRFLSVSHKFWAKHHIRSKLRESIPLLIVRRSYDSNKWKKNNEMNTMSSLCLRLPFTVINLLRTETPNQLLHISNNFSRGYLLHINLLVYMSSTDVAHSSLQHRYSSVKFLELGDNVLFGSAWTISLCVH